MEQCPYCGLSLYTLTGKYKHFRECTKLNHVQKLALQYEQRLKENEKTTK